MIHLFISIRVGSMSRSIRSIRIDSNHSNQFGESNQLNQPSKLRGATPRGAPVRRRRASAASIELTSSFKLFERIRYNFDII